MIFQAIRGVFMDYGINVIESSVTLCRLTGKYDRNVLKEAISESYKRMEGLQSFHLLVDAKEVVQVFGPDLIRNETERIGIANRLISAFGHCKDVKIAAVVNREDINHFVQFLVKRKGIELELFDNLMEAKKWIV